MKKILLNWNKTSSNISKKKRRLYFLLSGIFLVTVIWVIGSLSSVSSELNVTSCVIKNITGYPCPSCGTTRSLINILQGNWYKALWWNPFGYIAFGFILIFPFWLTYDILKRKTSMVDQFIRLNKLKNKPILLIFLFSLAVLNWIWNIIKGV